MRLGRLPRVHLDSFILLLMAVVGVAALFPARGVAADVVSAVTKIAIALLFFLYGARLSPAQAVQGAQHWRLHLMVLGTTFVVFPLLGLAAFWLAPTVLTPALYDGLLYLCLVPSTVQSSIAFTSMARGNVAAAIVSASLSNIVGVVLTPVLVVALMASARIHIDGSAVLEIVVQLLVPFAAGQLARRWIAGWVQRHATLTHAVDRGAILLVVYAAFSMGMTAHIWTTVTPWRIVALTAVCTVLLALVMGIAVGLARLTRLQRGDAVVLLFCGSKKSLASGLPMALVLFSNATAVIVLPLMIFHQIQLVVCALVASRLARSAPPVGPAG